MKRYTKEDASRFVRRWIRIQEVTMSGIGGTGGGSQPGLANATYPVPLGGMLRRVFPWYRTGYAKDPRTRKKKTRRG
jgi:hypothetical protein